MLDLNRKIVISCEISQELAEMVITRILEINEYDSRAEHALKEYEREPIEIYINSGGGSATDGFAIISAMEMSDTPIITYGIGIIASMALAIFLAGDLRIASRYSRFMYHAVSYGMIGHITDHEEAHKESNVLQEMYDSLVLERTNIPYSRLKQVRREKKDAFFSAEKAKELGVVHEVFLREPAKVKDGEGA